MRGTSISFSTQHQPVFFSEIPSSDTTGRITEHRPRALVVDDNPDIREMLAMFLQYSGYEVATASSAAAAVRTARAKLFDVVISDIGMPEMNGYELAQTLRALPEYQVVPLVAVTGFAMYDDHDRAIQAGFNAHLSKPIDPVMLVQLMDRLRGRKSPRADLSGYAAPLRGSTHSGSKSSSAWAVLECILHIETTFHRSP